MISPHALGALRFDGVPVTADDVLGEPDAGFRVAMDTLNLFRPSVGAFAVGMAQAALDATVAHTARRDAFGGRLKELQSVAHQVAEMSVRTEAARLMVYAAATAYDEGAADVPGAPRWRSCWPPRPPSTSSTRPSSCTAPAPCAAATCSNTSTARSAPPHLRRGQRGPARHHRQGAVQDRGGPVTAERVNPPDLAPAAGFSHAVVATGTRLVFLAGQTALDGDGKIVGDTLPEQFTRALGNLLTALRAAGGTPADLARVTVYATDVAAYRTHARELGRVWRDLAGRDYPAMAVVQVVRLWDEEAMVELDGFALLP